MPLLSLQNQLLKDKKCFILKNKLTWGVVEIHEINISNTNKR